ncbi:MAG: hypothetical protein GY903_07970 [Fuerstiella sp.]|nr:hypothetical protein [Fuerstiella sp.]
MASPFKFFRKYSSGMMIVMVILSMLLFTLDSLFSDTSANLWLLGLLAGGAVFGIAGVGQGRWLQWGLGGAALGAALGFVLPGFVEGNGLSTSLGVIDEEEMNDLQTRRSIANQFVMQASVVIHTKQFGEQFGEQYGRQMARLFGFGHQSNTEDVIFGKLMRAEADRIGITINDDMVNEYLKSITSDKLTEEDYVKIRNGLSYNRKSMNDETLFAILGDEVKAQLAYLTLRPRTSALPPGPEVYWQYFRRLNVRQQLNTVALDVDQFVDEVGQPTPTEVEALFAQFSRKFPNQDGPGTPGFRLDFRAKLAYLELDYASMEEQAGEIADADIEVYYEENKETPMIRTPIFPDTPDEKTTEPAEPPSADGKPATETEAEKTDEPSPEQSESSPKEDEAPQPQPVTEQPQEENPADTKPEATSDEAPEKADSPPEAATEDGESDDSCGPFESDEEAVAADEKTEPPVTEESSSSTEIADEKTSTESAKSEPADEPKTPSAEEKPDGDAKPAEPTDDEANSTQPGLTIPSAPDSPAKTGDEPAEIEYEYRSLDDELKNEIREEILRQRVREAIDVKMAAAVAQMETLARERSTHRFSFIEKNPEKFEGPADQQSQALKDLREKMRSFDTELGVRLKEYAEKNAFAYVETPLISYADFLDDEDFPISSATRPDDNPMMAAQSPNVAATVFGTFSNDEQNNDAQLFMVRRAQRRTLDLSGGESHYAHWAIDFSVSHIPEIDEPGIRDDVELAWKRIKARELVLERGEELAQEVRDGLAKAGEEKQDMVTSMKDKTATGAEDSAALAVRSTLPFSWLRTSSAPQMNFQQPPQVSMSPIQFADGTGGSLELAGDNFMNSVFTELADEQVGVVANANLSKYYVVHVNNRFPTPEVGEDGLRERFLVETQKPDFSRSSMIGVMQQQLGGPPSLAWEKKVWLRYDIDPDGEAEE